MRLFLDANVLFSAAIGPAGAAAGLIALGEAGACALVTSALAVTEASRNLSAKAPAAMDRWEVLAPVVGIVPEADPRLLDRVGVALDAKDRPILAAALGFRATVLV
ncbi:MAG: PIN domain-containing protein, partial [Trueperaceae bacterium]